MDNGAVVNYRNRRTIYQENSLKSIELRIQVQWVPKREQNIRTLWVFPRISPCPIF